MKQDKKAADYFFLGPGGDELTSSLANDIEQDKLRIQKSLNAAGLTTPVNDINSVNEQTTKAAKSSLSFRAPDINNSIIKKTASAILNKVADNDEYYDDESKKDDEDIDSEEYKDDTSDEDDEVVDNVYYPENKQKNKIKNNLSTKKIVNDTKVQQKENTHNRNHPFNTDSTPNLSKTSASKSFYDNVMRPFLDKKPNSTRLSEKYAAAYNAFEQNTKELNNRLKDTVDYHIKQAKLINTGNDLDFEKQFEQIAYDYIKQRAPALMPYIVGFQVVDKNEDNTKAVGMYGFKVGDNWLYTPIFYSNANLKGHELLYIQSQDRFVPLKDNWVSLLINKRTFILGRDTEKSLGEVNANVPDMQQVTRQPRTYKYGSSRYGQKSYLFDYDSHDVTTKELNDNIKLAAMVVFDACTTNIHTMNKFANLSNLLDLKPILENSTEACKILLDTFNISPLYKHAFYKIHGTDYILNILNNIREKTAEYKQTNKAMISADPLSLSKVVDVDIEPTQGVGDKVKFIINSANQEETWNFLSENHKKRLLNKGYTTVDNRPDTETSVIIHKNQLNFTIPTAPGVYDVLMNDGTLEKCLILFTINSATYNNERAKNAVLVISLSNKRSIYTSTANILCFGNNAAENFDEWYSKLPKGKIKIKKDDYTKYEDKDAQIILNQDGEATCAFRADDTVENNVYHIYWPHIHAEVNRWMHGPGITSSFIPCSFDLYGMESRTYIAIDKLNTTKFKKGIDTLYVPFKHKVFDISCEKLNLGDMSVVQDTFMNKFSSLNVKSTHDDEFFVNDVHMTKHAAMEKIICDEGFREEDAENIIKAANSSVSNITIQYVKPKQLIEKTGNAPEFIRKQAATLETIHKEYHLLNKDDDNRKKRKERYRRESSINKANTDKTVSREKTAATWSDDVPRGSDGSLTRDIGGAQDFHIVPPMISEPTINNAVIQEPTFQMHEVGSVRADQLNPAGGAPGQLIPPDPLIVNKATEAANKGQVEIFNTHTMEILLKNSNEEKLISNILPVLELAVDKIGRMLVQFYYHNNKYVERFGSVDTPDLENNLLSNFESLGDLCLFLRQKDIRPLQDLSFNSDVLGNN